MEYNSITFRVENKVATITLNSPPLNIISIAMMAEISDAIEQLREAVSSGTVTVVAFAASGEKAFSAGVEISEHTPELVGKMLTSFHEIFRKLAILQQKSGLVSVAQVNGLCLGGGCELACFCDVVVATEKSKFGTPEIKLGCFPPVAAALFPEMIGRRQAERLMFSGEIISAKQALRIGLVTDVVAETEFAEKVESVIESISNKSSAVLNLLRKSEPDWRAGFLRQLDVAEKVYLEELTQLADMQEGIDAYQQKRAPHWKHQ